jgi:hypothetical protein
VGTSGVEGVADRRHAIANTATGTEAPFMPARTMPGLTTVPIVPSAA